MTKVRSQGFTQVSRIGQRCSQWFQIHLDRLIMIFGIVGFAIAIFAMNHESLKSGLTINISRSQALPIAQQVIAQEQGYGITGYESVSSFSGNYSASMYFQRKLGIAETKRRILGEKLPIYEWETRWFKPLEQEEFQVSLAPDTGKVISFSHIIPETQPGAVLESSAALKIAQTYLTQLRGWQLQDWQKVTSSSLDQPSGRRDHTFEWKRKAFQMAESELRLTVNVQGDRVNYYSYWVKLPEQYGRQFRQERNIAGFIASLTGSLGWNLAIGIADVAYIWAVMTKRRRWYQGWIPVAAVMAIRLLSDLNDLPLSKIAYVTTENYGLFWAEQLYDLVISVAIRSGSLFMLWAGGQEIAKLVWQGDSKILQAGTGDRWVDLARSTWRGFMLAGISLLYRLSFYGVAEHLGAWSPMPSGYSNVFSTVFPVVSALESGFLPGFGEESEARLVGIAFMLWAFRGRRSLALIIPGGLWALAHLGYVTDPLYLRGLELSIVALCYGLVFMKFDLTTTIWCHATYNAMLSVNAMFQSGDRYMLFCAAIVILLLLSPTLPLWKNLRSGGGLSVAPVPHVSDLLPADLPLLQAWDGSKPWQTWLETPDRIAIGLRWKGALMGWAIALVKDAKDGRSDLVSAEVVDLQVMPKDADRWGEGKQARLLFSVLQAKLQQLGITDLQAQSHTPESGQFWANQGWKPTLQVMTSGDRPTYLNWSRLWDAIGNWRKTVLK